MAAPQAATSRGRHLPANWSRVFVAEGIGTFALTFVGIAAVATSGLGQAPAATSLVAIALANGLIVTVMVAALRGVSGAHFNPAVSFAFVIRRRLPLANGLLYWAAQLLGAILAALILLPILGIQAVPCAREDLALRLPIASGGSRSVE